MTTKGNGHRAAARKTGVNDNPQREVIAYAATGQAKFDLGLTGNPCGCSPLIDELFAETARQLGGYERSSYPRLGGVLEKELGHFYQIPSDMFYVGGAGTVGIIASVFDSRLVPAGGIIVTPETTFPAAAVSAKGHDVRIFGAPLNSNFRIDFELMKNTLRRAEAHGTVGAVFICNPNNPTGLVESTTEIIALARAFPQVLVMVSEANIELVHPLAMERIGGSLLDPGNSEQLLPNILVLRSFSKAYGLANERIGYAVGDPRIVRSLKSASVPFAVTDRQVIEAMIALQDQKHVVKSREYIFSEVAKIVPRLKDLGFRQVTESDSNLILAGVPPYFEGGSDELVRELKARDCSIVNCEKEFGAMIAGKFVRLAPNSREKNEAFLDILTELCDKKEREFHRREGQVSRRPFSEVIQSTPPPSAVLGGGR